MAITQKRLISWDDQHKIMLFEVDHKRYKVQFLSNGSGQEPLIYFFREKCLLDIQQDLAQQSLFLSEVIFKPEVESPLDGMIVRINVSVGQVVKKNDSLVVIEAMKMENVLYADHDAIIKSLPISVGDVVHQHQVLMSLIKKGEEDYGASHCTNEQEKI